MLTANGEEDEFVCPEGLPNYKVPPTGILEPTVQTAVSSSNDEQVSVCATDRLVDENDVEMVEECDEGVPIKFISDSDVMLICEYSD